MSFMLRSLLFGLALTLVAGSASALSIDFGNCDPDGCEGSRLSMNVKDLGGSFDVTLTLDSTGYTGTRTGLNQIGFLAIKGWSSVSLLSTPGGLWSQPIEANISSAGLCANGGTTDKVCSSGYVDITNDAKYSWTFRVVGGSLLTTDQWHFGGQYASSSAAAKGHIISASPRPTPAIPEPSAALLFGLGGVVAAASTRKGSRTA